MPANPVAEGSGGTAAEPNSAGASRGRFDELRARIAPLSQRRLPTVVLGVLIAFATWGTGFGYPIAGLDPSWGGGLYLAHEEGLSFGPEVSFTYGPLGFLTINVNWDTTLASLAFVWSAALHIALACGVLWSLRRSFGGLVATLVTFLVLALLPFLEVALPLTALLCFAALARDRPRYAVESLVVVGATFAAVMSLAKLSIGPLVFGLCLLALVGARARARQLALFVGLFVVELLSLWVLTGQSLGDLPEFVSNGRQIISGYSEAMISGGDGTSREQTLGLLAAIVVLVAFVIGSAFASYRDGRARLLGVGVAALTAFALFKEGVVRMDVPHLTLYFSTIAVTWLALSWSSSRRWLLAGGAVVLCAIAMPLTFRDRPVGAWDALKFPSSIDLSFQQIDLLFSPGLRTDISEYARALLQQDYAIEAAALAELAGHSVSVAPWEIGAVWAYDLDWEPLPVFQDYTAYTSELDELNAAAVASPSGPERILRGKTPLSAGQPPAQAIDGRYPAWDPPAQALATLCNFAPLQTSSEWQVLGRVPDRCAEPEPIGSVDSSYGETVDVPAAGRGEVVFVRIEGAEVGGLESLRTLLYRASYRYATLDGGAVYRLVPGTAADGLMLRGDPRVTGRGTFEQAPQTETLTLTGPSGDLRYEFFSMKVAGAPGADNGRGEG